MQKTEKRKLSVMPIFIVAMMFIGSQALAAQDPLQELYKAAKAEGKVFYWGPSDPEELEPVVKAFKQKYPGIEFQQFEIRSDDFVPRTIAEARQGKVSYDVGEGRIATFFPLLERDLIQSYQDWRSIFKDIRAEAISENGRLLTWYNMVYPVAYNTNLVKPEDVPKSWDDLLEPRWKGKLLVEVRANAFAYVGLKWGEEKIVSYVKRLKEQKPVFVKGGTTVLQQLSAGVAPLGIGTYLHKVIQVAHKFEKREAPVDWAKRVSPLGATNTCNYIVKGAPHPNAAKLFVGFMCGEEGIKIKARTAFFGPMYPGSPVPGVEELLKNNVELIVENSDNFNRVNQLNKIVVEALGVLK